MPKMKSTNSDGIHFVPYISRFKPPSKRARLAAGRSCEELSLSSGLWNDHSRCTSEDDWLAQYPEPGQSFNQFTGSCPWLSRRCKVKGLEEIMSKVEPTYPLISRGLHLCHLCKNIVVLPWQRFVGTADTGVNSIDHPSNLPGHNT